MQTLERLATIHLSITSAKKIAIVDDDEKARNNISLRIEDMEGFEPILIEENDEYCSDANKLAFYIAAKGVYGVICDHRLSTYGFANFFGSKLVAALYDRKIPSILITQFFSQDLNDSIREYRDKIPVLMERGNINSTEIIKGIEYCYSEINGDFSKMRKPYNTLVRVDSFHSQDGKDVIDAIIPSWNYDAAVRFPKSIIPEELHQRLEVGTRLFADVNIGAETNDQIYLKNFELAPDPRGIDINDLIS